VVDLLRISDGRILLGSLGSGVFVTGDGGWTWENWSQDLGTANTVTALVEEEGKVLAATEDGLMARGLSPGMFWVPAGRDLPRVVVSGLVRSGKTLWAATAAGLYAAGRGEVFKPVEGISGSVSSLAEEEGVIAALVGGRVFLRSPDGEVEELQNFADGTSATAVALLDGTLWAGSGQGVYSWDGHRAGGDWIKGGGPRYPVTGLVKIDDRLGAITRGGGTFWLP
jgi:hypothetical protein